MIDPARTARATQCAAADERVLNKTGLLVFRFFLSTQQKLNHHHMVSVMDKWPARAHHVRRLQGVLVRFIKVKSVAITPIVVLACGCRAPSLLCSIPKEGGCFGIRRTPEFIVNFKGAAQKCFSSGVRALPTGLAAINAPTVPPASNVSEDVPNPPLVIPQGPQILRLRCRYQNWYPPINMLCDPILCRVRFPNFCHHRLPYQTGSQWEQLGW